MAKTKISWWRTTLRWTAGKLLKFANLQAGADTDIISWARGADQRLRETERQVLHLEGVVCSILGRFENANKVLKLFDSKDATEGTDATSTAKTKP